MNFIGEKKLVYLFPIILLHLRFCEYVMVFGATSVKKVIFVKNRIIKVRILKSFCTLCDTYNRDYLHHISLLLNRFSVKYRFPFQFAFFIIESPCVIQRSVSQENAFKQSKNLWPFPLKTIFNGLK